MGTCVNRRKTRAAIGVGAEICQESLLDAARDSRQFINHLLKKVNVRRTCARRTSRTIARRWNTSRIPIPLAVILVEADDGLNNAAAEKAAAVIVDIEAKIESGAKGVLAVDPREVVHDLRRGDRSLRVGREAVWPLYVQRRSQHAIVSPDGNFLGIRKAGI